MIQGISEKAVWQIMTRDLFGTFAILFILGLIGSWISERLGISDLLVYARDIRKSVELLLKYLRCDVGNAYVRKETSYDE